MEINNSLWQPPKLKSRKKKNKKRDEIKNCIAGFHLTSWRPCWCTLNKRILIISFVWDTNMAAVSIVFCVSWDNVKTKNIANHYQNAQQSLLPARRSKIQACSSMKDWEEEMDARQRE